MTDLPPWTQQQFEQYVAIALDRMAREGVVRSDEVGRAVYRLQPAERTAEGSLRIRMTADLSMIGLPADVPLVATTQRDGSVAWNLGHVPIRTFPASSTPEEAGEGLGANQLRAAQRRSQEPVQSSGWDL